MEGKLLCPGEVVAFNKKFWPKQIAGRQGEFKTRHKTGGRRTFNKKLNKRKSAEAKVFKTQN